MATLKIRLAQISQIPGHIRWRCILFSPPKRQTGKSFRICLLWCWSMTLELFFKSANDFDLDLKFLSVRFFGRTFCMSWHFGPTSFGIIERDNLRSVSIRWRQFKFNIFRSIYVFVDFFCCCLLITAQKIHTRRVWTSQLAPFFFVIQKASFIPTALHSWTSHVIMAPIGIIAHSIISI